MKQHEALRRLEHRVQFLTLYAVGATAFALLRSPTPQVATSFDVVTARRFVVLDENGSSRAVLG